MAKKIKWVQIMAFLALFWIVIWIVWTWILSLYGWWQTISNEQNINPEQYKQLQDLIKSQWWTWTLNSSWTLINTWTIINTWSINSSESLSSSGVLK